MRLGLEKTFVHRCLPGSMNCYLPFAWLHEVLGRCCLTFLEDLLNLLLDFFHAHDATHRDRLKVLPSSRPPPSMYVNALLPILSA